MPTIYKITTDKNEYTIDEDTRWFIICMAIQDRVCSVVSKSTHQLVMNDEIIRKNSSNKNLLLVERIMRL